jgi:cell division GTPase FtsZ
LDIYAERQASIDLKSTELSEQIQEVEDQIKAEKEVWSADDESKKRAVRVTVVVYAEQDGPAQISITYRQSIARIMLLFSF